MLCSFRIRITGYGMSQQCASALTSNALALQAKIPKQYLELKGLAIACHSFLTFARMQETREIVIVCEDEWKPIFEEQLSKIEDQVNVRWAAPGKERQDSVYNGFAAIETDAELVAIHDSARPLLDAEDFRC